MMIFDPIEIAEEIQRAYATDFIGDRNILFSYLLSRYGDPTTSSPKKLSSFIRMKGPYIQALSIPVWSSSTWPDFANSVSGVYANKGLDHHIVTLLTQRGFKKLYEYQERAIKAILDEKNTLVVAGTGRGKTESWLIPIAQFILMAKHGKIDSHPPRSVKSILVYPTKSLAQDQLKRLISYLFELNKSFPEEMHITVGVYDGDTPSLADPTHMTYLWNAFKYFKCPLFNSDLVLCRSCDARNDHSLMVIRGDGNAPRLVVPNSYCRKKASLDFIHLARETIRDERTDIILTNPDTLNFRLININVDEEQAAFIKEPKYLVLDEIHTLTGLFGSFVSVLMKRYMLARKNLLADEDDLRIIAASATIRNKEEIFRKIIPFQKDIAVIEEDVKHINRDFPSILPDFLLKSPLLKEDIVSEARKQSRGEPINPTFASLFKAFKLESSHIDPSDSDDKLETLIKEKLFQCLTSELDDTPNLDILRALHAELSSKARTPNEIFSLTKDHYKELSKESLSNLIINFFSIGEISGILENRVHLFSWPLDGYYACVNCGKVYDSSQGECEVCHHHSIFRILACRQCDEEALESWFCPKCFKLYPTETNVEGRPTFYESFECGCTGEDTPCIKVIWKPYFKCTRCGKITKWNFIQRCDKCGSRMIMDETGSKLQCINPECQARKKHGHDRHCSICNSEMRLVTEERFECPVCGRKEISGNDLICECGATKHPVLYLPWVCDNEDCSEVYNSERPPDVCKCGSKRFYLAGLFNMNTAYYCKDCNVYFAIPSCGNEEHELVLKALDSGAYKLIGNDFKIHKTDKSRRAVPCYHPYARYNRKRYSLLARSPENVAVTSAQHALRKIVGKTELADLPSSLKRTKMLSFADTHGDMNRLDRDFQEPEQEWFIDQLIVSILEKSDEALKHLYDRVIEEFDKIQDIYPKSLSLANRIRIKPQQRNLEKDELLRSEVDKRIIGGYFYNKWETPRLVTSGIINVKLDLESRVQLTRDERILLKELLRYNNMDLGKLSEHLSSRLSSSLDEILQKLESMNLINENGGRIRISPERIICSLVSSTNPIAMNQKNESFYSTINEQTGENLSHCVKFNLSYRDRTDLFAPFFSKTAYRINYSSPVMMLSETYKGTTEKRFRRELEYQFKNGYYPNFLSSGPAMELGIDIGSLDLLCIFGTPPNINSYLQRIGRAGRETKRSLVFSVSKRNPIDYYYYRNPLELIQSAPQPIQLNEHNPEVLRISLTWALFDFIAAKYWVPWQKHARPDGVHITDGEDFVRKETSTGKPSDILSFTSIYSNNNIELDFGNSLRVLGKIIRENKHEARKWLSDLLNYSFCPRCGRHYPSVYVGNCQSSGCSEPLVQAKDSFSSLIDYAVDSFDEHFISLASKFLSELRSKRRQLEKERDILEDNVYYSNEEGEDQRRALLLRGIEERIDGIQKLRNNIENMSYSKFHKRSKENKYAFQIRTIEDIVDVIHYRQDKTGRQVPALENRNIGMALKEYHPYAVTTSARQKSVACKFIFDEWKRAEISQVFPDQVICTQCFEIYSDLKKQRCDCGGELKILQTQVPRTIEVYSDTYNLRENVETGRGMFRPLDLHALTAGGQEVKTTFPNIQNRVIEYNPSQSFTLCTDEGTEIGKLDYGEITLATSTDHYNSFFEQGFMDPNPRFYELCGVEECNSVVSQKGNHLCASNHNHDLNLKKYVRLAYIFKTFGIRVTALENEGIITHTFAHGIRVGLQNIAGVHIRNIGEVVEGNSTFIYDSEPGGSGVTLLLTSVENGLHRNFEQTIKLVYDQLVSCKCDDGCPHCLYQYGCAEHNDPRTLSRKKTVEWMKKGVSLVEKPAKP